MLAASRSAAVQPARRTSPALKPALGQRIARLAPLRAAPEPNEPSTSGSPKEADLEKFLQQLSKNGLNREKAKDVLKRWESLGVKDADQLRKLLINRSVKPAATIGFQALLDAGACWGGFYTAGLIGDADPFPFQLGLQLVANFFGMYYVIQVFLNLSIASTLLWTAYKYGTNSKEILMAVQQLAGPASGLNVLDKAQVAVNTLRVLGVLEEVAQLLKEIPTYNVSRGTLQNLSAYLTLNWAKQQYGFEPSKYGLSERDAGEVAYVFSMYDDNDDQKLDASELRKLCAGLGKELDEAETKEALRFLDSNKNGVIDFEEFVAWWVKLPGAMSAMNAAQQQAENVNA